MLELLFQGRFQEYAESLRRGAKTWLFIHVPKTAGSSLSHEISAELRPYYNIHIDHSDTSRPGPERFDTAVEQFLTKAPSENYRGVSGHILQRHVQAIRRRLPGVRTITLLREPLSRLISDYNYQRSAAHPFHLEVAKRAPDFMSFIEQPGPRNRMARHLVPTAMIRRDRFDEAIAHVMRSLDFVGVQERYDLFFRFLTFITLGRVKSPVETQRVAGAKPDIQLTPEELALIRERNRMDYEIYGAMMAKLSPVLADMEGWLTQQTMAQR